MPLGPTLQIKSTFRKPFGFSNNMTRFGYLLSHSLLPNIFVIFL
ncbi:hypothetical protein AAJ76_4800033253 [Vairimorpha ceranae]|uniref:Uncharacterized protein n=1 Tax=Vairimorpha ceranae TaxID=40302 RepID=A0A0F9WAY4_9MICR|nr:hypothetical protein AAJ76_4800033253 [Vairimorpha ceranae]KKO74746.1 hypothetical protein AAJ76_4800033253 [Vairimorpha ceranae]